MIGSMRSGVIRTVCGVAFVAVVCGCTTTVTVKRVPPESRICHVVLCWLKDSGNAEQRRKLVDVSKSFRSIPGVRDVIVGEVVTSEREIVDSSFDVGILVTFATEADMQAYLVHPDHVRAARETLKPLVSKVVVYDFKETARD